MNGIERISEKIMAESRQKADAILAQAEAEARDIAAKGAERAERETAAALAASEARVADIGEKARLAADLAHKKALQNERQALINETFDRALEELAALPEERYLALLVSLAVKAADDGAGGELLLNERDRDRFGETVTAEVNKRLKGTPLTLASDAAPIVGGVVVRRGRIELNCALDVIVRMLSEDSAFYVSNALFGKGA